MEINLEAAYLFPKQVTKGKTFKSSCSGIQTATTSIFRPNFSFSAFNQKPHFLLPPSPNI